MKAGAISIALSALALGIAGVTMTKTSSTSESRPSRIDQVAELERRIDALSQEFALWRTQRQASPLAVHGWDSDDRVADSAAGGGTLATPGGTDSTKELEAIVNDAVNKKTARVLDKMRIKKNKKPEMDAFASVLELTDEQREETERVVIEGQREVHAILNRPTTQGNNLMDDLINCIARGFVTPGKDNGWRRWWTQLGEKMPGSQETYGASIERVKNGMRESFQREWTPTQYRDYREWGVDPTEIQKIEGSPNDGLWGRVATRARELGAKIDDKDMPR
ncbi:MAG: hypothetical protein V3T86_18040 [Planctomycetota bacterium]